MPDKTLSLSDFTFVKTEVNVEKIKKFHSENQFMPLSLELFKEVGIITSILSCTYRLDSSNQPRKFNRNEAILGGLMVRINKLQIALLDQICQKRMEIAHILFRCLSESIINLMYLLKRQNDTLFDEFIEYSLREEKRLLNYINENIRSRGYELPIEKRMKESIKRAFDISGFSSKQVDETKWKPWGEKIYERAKNIGMEKEYLPIFGLPSHSVHGNWQDLITYHLHYKDGKFLADTNWGHPRPHILFVAALFSAEINKLYLDELIPDCLDKHKIIDLLNDLIERVRIAVALHEQYLQRAIIKN